MPFRVFNAPESDHALLPDAEKTKDASYLPPGFEAVLQELCPNQLQPPGAQTKGHARTKQPKEPRQRAPRKTTQAATAR